MRAVESIHMKVTTSAQTNHASETLPLSVTGNKNFEVTDRSVQKGWRGKVDPEFRRWVCVLREIEETRATFPDDLSPAEMKKLVRAFGEKFGSLPTHVSNDVINAAAQVYLGIWDPKFSEPSAMAYLCNFRFRFELGKLLVDYHKLRPGAASKLVRLFEDMEEWRAGRRLKNFKSNTAHDIRFLFGITHGLGSLKPKELTKFFDDTCGCGKDHGGEWLRQERTRKHGPAYEIALWLDSISDSPKFDHTEQERKGTRFYKRGHAIELTRRWRHLQMNDWVTVREKINGRWKERRVKYSTLPKVKRWLEADRPKQAENWFGTGIQVRLRYDRMKHRKKMEKRATR